MSGKLTGDARKTALAGLKGWLEVTGRGIVVSQMPPPGAPLPAGALCRLALASPAARP